MYITRLRPAIASAVFALLLIGSLVMAAHGASPRSVGLSEYQSNKLQNGLTFAEMHDAMEAYASCIGEQPTVDEATLVYSERDGWFSHVVRSAAGMASEAVEGATGQACHEEYIAELEVVYAEEHAMNSRVVEQLHERLAQCLGRVDFADAYSSNSNEFVACYSHAVDGSD